MSFLLRQMELVADFRELLRLARQMFLQFGRDGRGTDALGHVMLQIQDQGPCVAVVVLHRDLAQRGHEAVLGVEGRGQGFEGAVRRPRRYGVHADV